MKNSSFTPLYSLRPGRGYVHSTPFLRRREIAVELKMSVVAVTLKLSYFNKRRHPQY